MANVLNKPTATIKAITCLLFVYASAAHTSNQVLVYKNGAGTGPALRQYAISTYVNVIRGKIYCDSNEKIKFYFGRGDGTVTVEFLITEWHT
jgi:hypothetical protein